VPPTHLLRILCLEVLPRAFAFLRSRFDHVLTAAVARDRPADRVFQVYVRLPRLLFGLLCALHRSVRYHTWIFSLSRKELGLVEHLSSCRVVVSTGRTSL